MVGEIVNEMDYLRTREQKLRDTNESTNERVKWFAFGTMGMLVGLGAWQVVYLRAYFRHVHFLLRPGVANDIAIGQSILFRASIQSYFISWAGSQSIGGFYTWGTECETQSHISL